MPPLRAFLTSPPPFFPLPSPQRVTFGCYIVYAVGLTSFIYPVVVFFGWNGGVGGAWRSNNLLFGCG